MCYSCLDMSSRQKLKATNDIFEMISENDEDIKFDDCGILKPVTVSKSTIVIVGWFGLDENIEMNCLSF